MFNHKNYLNLYPEVTCRPGITVLEGMKILDKTCAMLLVVNRDGRLVGTVADSDIRKGLIGGKRLESPIYEVMNRNPAYINEDDHIGKLGKRLSGRKHMWVPVLNADRKVVSLLCTKDPDTAMSLGQGGSVLIMAGGLGTRLRPLTTNTPKPMVDIGGRPLLEIIIERLKRAGFDNYFLAVHYLPHVIQNYFGDGERFGVNINYIQEDKPLGTAGALSMLKGKIDSPILVTNGDLLTKLNFNFLVKYHETENNLATICVREKSIGIPYGVVRLNDSQFHTIEEKPEINFLINCGIYMLSPDVLDFLHDDERIDMPDLIERVKRYDTDSVGCFPITESWVDIGNPEDYKYACDNAVAF